MSRMNNKGFLLAESLIVSTFVLTVLIFLFVQFKNLMVNHKQSYTYNSVENIYDLGSMADYFKNNERSNNALSTELNAIGSSNNLVIYENNECKESVLTDGAKSACDALGQKIGFEYIIYTDSDVDNINLANIKYQEMRDFIDKVDATPVQNKGRLFAKFSNGNFATIAMEQKIDVTIPFRSVTYELGDGNNLNWWSKLYPAVFTNISYNQETKMNTIDVTTSADGWEQLYLPLQTLASQTYKVYFDYKIVTEMPGRDDTHTGVACQVIAENNDSQSLGTEVSSSDHQSENDLKIATISLPKEAGTTGTAEIAFEAKENTTGSFLIFNFGYMKDGETGQIEIGNIRVVEDVTGRTMYGPMLSPKFGQPDDTFDNETHHHIQPVVAPHHFRGWFDETHLDQYNNQIEIRETTAISPSLFTDDGKETVVAHFD